MEILNSGSFVPLDNREKVEQLIFTAREFAFEVSRNEGFWSSGQTNQQIGLELWKGAEYMTRSHEEVTIRNIFLSKFLESLREIEREPNRKPSTPTTLAIPLEEKARNPDAPIPPSTQADVESKATTAVRDEFLGVVEDLAEVRPSYASECIPECEDEIASMLSSAGASNVIDAIADQNKGQGQPEPAEEKIEPTEVDGSGSAEVEPAIANENGNGDKNEIKSSEEHSDVPEGSEPAIEDEQLIRSVVIAEQEPYNFDSCTVTAVLQLLPETNGQRDCVVSVRSHDFAPQIIFSNVRRETGQLTLDAQLTAALEQYRTALPALAAEKVKKEKPSAKKRSSKTTVKNSNTTVQKPDTAAATSPNPAVQEQAKDQQDLFAS